MTDLTENICKTCKGTGGELDKHAPPVDEFGNTPDFLPCDDCDGSGLARSVLDALSAAECSNDAAAELGRRDGQVEKQIAAILKMIADEEELGTSDNNLISIIVGELEELRENFWGEPPEDPT